MPFGLGRPVRSTLTLLILVPCFSPTPRTDPAALSPAPLALYTLTRLHVPARPLPTQKTAGTPKGAASAMDATPFRWILAQRARFLAGDYGRRYPEGMLGVASALPGTRTFTA